MTSLSSLTQLATQRTTDGEPWFLLVDDLEELYDPVTLYRVVYDLRMVDTDRFSAANSGELVTLLERLGENNAEHQLRAAGLYLSHDDRIELMRRLVRGIKIGAAVAPADPDSFRTMLRDTHSYVRAVDAYIAAFIDIDGIINRIAREFSTDAGRPDVVIPAAIGKLRLLIQRKIVIVEQVTPALFDLLRTIAQQEGFLRRGAEPRPSADGRTTGDPGRRGGELARGEREAALEVFHLQGKTPSGEELHRRYRDLMRQYHPDINPKGLETAKRINRAYSTLTSDEEA